MSDGSRGYTAKQGVEAVLGGKDIDKMNKGEGAMSPGEMREYLLDGHDDDGYADASRKIGGWYLTEFEKDPSLMELKESEQWEEMKKRTSSQNTDFINGCTGFMVGWAVNAARYALGKNQVANPAIMTI